MQVDVSIVRKTEGSISSTLCWGSGRKVNGGMQKCGGRVSVYDDSIVTCSCPHIALSTMNPQASSIFKDGKLKPGVYKIQNLCSGTYLDIHRHSREVCCRPARDLEDGRGLVSLYLPSVPVRVSDDQKWEIKSFGAGYTIRMVSLST